MTCVIRRSSGILAFLVVAVRLVVGAVQAIGAGGQAVGASEAAGATARPNIVLIVADDHGKDALGCYGNPLIKTPALDRLAATGTLFTRAFCTTASCSASRSVILTGLHNHANGTYGHTHGKHHFSCFENVVTLPRMMSDAGYRTGRVGKKHYAPERAFPWDWQRWPCSSFS